MSRPETGRTGARFGAPARRSRDPEDPADPAPEPAEAPAAETGEATATGETTETVGLTGARFGGRARTTRRQRQAEKERASAVPPPDADGSDPTPPEPEDARPTVELPRITGEASSAEPDLTGSGVAVRPYVLTGGRTRVRAELRIETLVSTVPPVAGGPAETGERRTVLELCDRPRSVSEVAALTRVPLGVARVLIDDLATEGRVRVHLGVDAATGPDVELMNRVLAGLRRL